MKWTYKPACEKGITGASIQDFCAQGNDICNIPDDVLRGLDRTRFYFVKEFRAKVLTAIQSNGFGKREKSALTKDSPPVVIPLSVVFPLLKDKLLPIYLAATDGPIDRTLQPFWATPPGFPLGDAFTFIEPVLNEKSVIAASGNARGDWDNIHLKEEPTIGVHFPGCNDPRFKGLDQTPCLHLHENWLNLWPAPNMTYSKGQMVRWYDLRFHAGEESPNHASSINNGEALAKPIGINFIGEDLVLWVESIAKSKDCGLPGGGLDNTNRPCIVFPQAMFFTPR